MIPATARAVFGLRVEDRYYSHDVCVTGRIAQAPPQRRRRSSWQPMWMRLTGRDEAYEVVVSAPDAIAIESEARVPPIEGSEGAFRSCDDRVVPPRVLREVKPNYTAGAMRAGVEGTTVLDVLVGTDGAASDLRIQRSVNALLDEPAAEAVRQWKFEPGTRDGKAVPVTVTVEPTFVWNKNRP